MYIRLKTKHELVLYRLV